MLLLRPHCCTVAAAVVSHERFRTITTTTTAVLLLRTPIGTVAVVTTAVLRRGPRDITAGATAATAGWKLQDISSGVMTRFRATENGRKRTTEISFILVPPVLSRKGDTVSSVACLLHSSMVAAIRCYRGGNDVSMRGRLVLNAVTHPMAVLATCVADPFESRRCPADPGHVALSPTPFTVGPRAVGRGRRFLLGPPSGVGTAVEWPLETKIRRQRF